MERAMRLPGFFSLADCDPALKLDEDDEDAWLTLGRGS
jgi:hypothetical protein